MSSRDDAVCGPADVQCGPEKLAEVTEKLDDLCGGWCVQFLGDDPYPEWEIAGRFVLDDKGEVRTLAATYIDYLMLDLLNKSSALIRSLLS